MHVMGITPWMAMTLMNYRDILLTKTEKLTRMAAGSYYIEQE
jgi:hypothetical protein